MKLTREVKFGAWLLAAVVIAAVSYFAGSSLRPAEEPFYVFDTSAPAYQPSVAIPALSPGGFTGLGDFDGSGSRTIVAGRVVEQDATGVVLELPDGHRTRVTFGLDASIRRLQPSDRSAIEPGATVSVMLGRDDDEAIAAVLVLD